MLHCLCRVGISALRGRSWCGTRRGYRLRGGSIVLGSLSVPRSESRRRRPGDGWPVAGDATRLGEFTGSQGLLRLSGIRVLLRERYEAMACGISMTIDAMNMSDRIMYRLDSVALCYAGMKASCVDEGECVRYGPRSTLGIRSSRLADRRRHRSSYISSCRSGHWWRV